MPALLRTVLLVAACVVGSSSWAQDSAAIRKTIAERLPNFPKIDEISKTPIPGLYEIRVGTDIYYSDEKGNHLIDGHLVDTATRTNLTQARIDKLTAIDPATLPVKDAIVWKQGTGARKLVVFADPNCGYCKRFERDLNDIKDVTVYTYLYPILGGDSSEKARNIWCAKDRTAAWRDWMLNGTAPPRAMGQCDASALERNAELGQKHKINGTPALVFEDGKRVGGAMNAAALEKQLLASRATKP
ncbi:MAG: DsbC family protein [Piscinibacter sp.]|uniref:DsbC family protein n=1 Tax=Piscinibacter sp. TaxID=1903157 RepID=UPI0025860E49|nr:DsbC family protein [Piscinibacter sp.]MCW5666949.1 DsbC family protein [Piscinibacter sp.]